MNLISVRGLEKTYLGDGVETPALRGVDLDIREGEFAAIVGPSGSGKSTLMQILGCLDRSTGGEYFLEGKEIGEYSDIELAHIRSKTMGFVFQTFNLLPRLSVLKNIILPLVYAGVPEAQRVKRAKEMILLVGLKDREQFLTLKLSGGEKQRVAIARALVNHPKIIFADEPTGSLDSKSGEVILKFLQDLHKKGHTVVLITHESYVAESAERIIHIKDGLIDKDEMVKKRRIIEREGFSK